MGHLLHLKTIRDIRQGAWFHLNHRNAQLLCLKMFWCLSYPFQDIYKLADQIYHFIYTLRSGEVKIYPKPVIFISDSFKTDYLLLPPPLLIF